MEIDIQIALEQQHVDIPVRQDFEAYVKSAYGQKRNTDVSITLRVVESTEIRALNAQYRQKDTATNVLSFGYDSVELPDMPTHIGDIILCHDVIVEQADNQKISLSHHYAHMVVHGVLHLCGYDHVDAPQAQIMEHLEAQILAKHRIPNPYLL